MMFNIASISALFISAALATTVSYDRTYDNSAGGLDGVACSNGPHGLMHLGYTTFGSLPDYPYIGGSSDVAAWDSPSCGSCYEVTYGGKSIYMLAIDHAGDGLNMSFEAMDNLTDGQAEFLGRVNATVTLVSAAQCGL